MKNLHIYRLLTASLIFLVSVSCHDKLLEPIPESVLTTSNAFVSAKDINLGVLGVYSGLQSKVQKDYLIMEATTDNEYVEYYATEPGISEMENLEVSSENHILNNFWKTSYNGIFRANSILINLDNPTDYAPNEKEKYEGEARFLRALFYLDLARVFGDVPLVTEPLSVVDAEQVGRTPQDQVFDLIIQDLTRAQSLLPSPSAAEWGRASSAAATALLARLYVFRNDWPNALTALDQVVNDYNYELVDHFGDLFQVATEQNSEAIFSVPFVEGTNGQGITYAFAPLGGIYQVIDNGSRVVRPTWDLHKRYDESDTRFPVTISETQLLANASPGDDPIWYPYINKYIVPIPGTSSGLDLPVVRLADMILLYSEALYRSGDVDEALNQLNRVRTRAFQGTSQNYTASDINTEEKFMDVVLLERRLELAFENQRWFDLVRTDRFTTELASYEAEYNPGSGTAEIQNHNVQPHMRYFPIPYEQIQLAAPGVLTQNPGY